MVSAKHMSVTGMIAITIALTFMDIKDLYYKINMCGPYPTFSFLLQTPEIVTTYDLTQAIKSANGTWLSPVNQWNALALQCDAFFPSQLEGKPAHLSSMGVGCTLGGVYHAEELMFVGSHRLDTFVWATGLLADAIHEPLPVSPYTSGLYASFYNLPERSYRAKVAAMIDTEDIAAINATVRSVAATFARRMDLWDKTLCYEMTAMVGKGETKSNIAPVEHGCIWMDMATGKTLSFHVEPATGKYYRALSEIMGLSWHTMDYLTLGNNLFLRARLYMKTYYQVAHTTDGQRLFWHFNQSDLGVDGALYIVLMVLECLILLINATDVSIVAANVVRPMLHSAGSVGSSRYSTTNSAVTGLSNRQQTGLSGGSMIISRKDQRSTEKEHTLSKMLLYTDLTSVSYRKPFLASLLVVDAVLGWLYVVPNSNVFAWASSAFQLGSAYLSMFRVWVIVLIVIDVVWKWTVVLCFEKVAALITELTYVTSFEIMLSTLLGIYLSFDDIMNICVFKYGLVDGQRALSPTTPTILSFYNSYSLYSYGDRTSESDALYYIYKPLLKITLYGIAFSLCVVVVRLVVRVAWLQHKGTLAGDVEAFWRSYHRNSAEVFMNNPLRANALIRSQQVMSYRFGKAVFIRPFVYLEQNYFITRGKFRARPAIPFLMNEDAEVGADVDTKSYMLADVYRDENSMKLHRKVTGLDVQIPLC